MSTVLQRARSRRSLALLSVFGFLATSTASGQAPMLRGSARLGDVGVEGVAVQLHRVTQDSAGVVAETTTGSDGLFSLRVPPPPDSARFNVVFATATYHGVRYFGAPLHAEASFDGYTVELQDTVLVAEGEAPIRVARRDIILLPEPDGAAEVNEIVRLSNPQTRTLVAAGGGTLWEFRIPPEAAAFEVGEGSVTPESIQRMGERVFLTGTFQPGERELLIRYRLPRGAGRTVLPLAAGTDSLNLFVRQPSPGLRVAALEAPESMAVEAETFLHFRGTRLERTPEIVLEWDRPTPAPFDPRYAAVGVAALVLFFGAVFAARRSRTR
ncbi:MAG: hypothetical protein M3483_02955 [Gemmatimonadota bacterium]|nr:hypothetical protein [Gemmatimonadota bacterium]